MLDSEMSPSSPASSETSAVDDASRVAVASKIDKTPGDSWRFCILEVEMARRKGSGLES